MTATIHLDRPGLSLLVPASLLAILAAVVAAQLGVALPHAAAAYSGPQTVSVAPRAYAYRAPGEYFRGTQSLDGPIVTSTPTVALEIMKHEVSASDYGRCVADGACNKARPRRGVTGDVPATGVSYKDAVDYAHWLSDRTGQSWRLPTIAEWTFAAGRKAPDPARGIASDRTNPAVRWLDSYEKESAASNGLSAMPAPLGSMGVNEFGVADLGGAVWEWTATCDSRVVIDGAGGQVSKLDSCGVHYLEGRHLSAMNVFVRDAQGGACSMGVPPDNLGFRLVREPSWSERAGTMAAGIIGYLGAQLSRLV